MRSKIAVSFLINFHSCNVKCFLTFFLKFYMVYNCIFFSNNFSNRICEVNVFLLRSIMFNNCYLRILSSYKKISGLS